MRGEGRVPLKVKGQTLQLGEMACAEAWQENDEIRVGMCVHWRGGGGGLPADPCGSVNSSAVSKVSR